MTNPRGMLFLLLLCLGGCLQASPTTTPPASIEEDNTACIEDVEGAWLEGLEAWTAVPPEVLQQWNSNEEEDNAPEVTTEAEELVSDATSEPSTTEASVTVHPEHHNHASPLKITFEGLRRKQLLNPNKDYTVVLESYIGAASQFLVVVSPYSNTSECSSGGFLPPNLDVENKAWTHAEDEIPKQGNSSVEVGSCFFSAQGQLEASDHVLLTYTPPECGCVTVRGYIAIVNGNHSEVAGPQEVPDVLDRLLCVDPHPDPMPENADIVENEVEITDNEISTVKPLVESGEIEGEDITGINKGRLGKAERKMARKNRRKIWRQQMKKTRGRAGWRQFKQQKRQRKQAKAARKQVAKGNVKPQKQNRAPWKIVKPLKPWKQQRKMWKQHKKHGKAGKWWKKNRHHGHSEDKPCNQTTDEHQHLNDTDEIHDEEHSMEEELEAENNALVEELLANSESEELTTEAMVEKPVIEENTDENEVDTTGRKMQKGHGKWKGKRKWHKKKSEHKQGVTFCCSQGIRTKKFILRLIQTQNLTVSNSTVNNDECILRKESVVTVYAVHNFNLKEDTCAAKFGKCCNNFTQNRWDQIIAKRQQKRQARKLKRKTAKHSRKQAHKQNNRHLKQERKQERQQERKQQRQQNRRNNNARRGNQV